MAKCYILLTHILDLLARSAYLPKNLSIFCEKLDIKEADAMVIINSYTNGAKVFRETLKTCLHIWIGEHGSAATAGALYSAFLACNLKSTAETLETLNSGSVCQSCEIIESSSPFKGKHTGRELKKLRTPAVEDYSEDREGGIPLRPLVGRTKTIINEINNNQGVESRPAESKASPNMVNDINIPIDDTEPSSTDQQQSHPVEDDPISSVNTGLLENSSTRITVHAISKLLQDYDVIFQEYRLFYDTLNLQPGKFSAFNELKQGYDKIKLTIEEWVLKEGNNATVGALHDAFQEMKQIYICGQLLEYVQNRRECVIVLQEAKQPKESQPLLSDDDKENNNQQEQAFVSKDLPISKKLTQDVPIKRKCKRTILFSLSTAVFIVILIMVIYLTGLPQKLLEIAKTEDKDASITPPPSLRKKEGGGILDILQLDTKMQPREVTEDGITTFMTGQYCKNQPRRRIRLSLGELKLFTEPSPSSTNNNNNSTHCLQNIVKLNVTGPLKPEVLAKVLDHSPNLKELVFYKIEKFCIYSQDYLAHHPTDDEEDAGESSVVKLVFQGFGGKCMKGVSILASVIGTSNLASIEVLGCDFEDGEINAIRKLVNRSPHLMNFTCCGEKCSKFKVYLKNWIVFVEKDDYIIFKRN